MKRPQAIKAATTTSTTTTSAAINKESKKIPATQS